MPNLGFHIEVLKQVINERVAAGDNLAKSLKNDASLMKLAVLGALGPEVFRYMPIGKPLATLLASLVPSPTSGNSAAQAAIQNATTQLQALTSASATPAQIAMGFDLYFNPVGAIYSLLFSSLVVPVWPILNHAKDVLDQLDAIAQNPPGNVALAEMLSGLLTEVNGLQATASGLSGLPTTVAVLEAIIAEILALGPWMELNQALPIPNLTPADPIFNRRDEFLRWHHTGRFAQNLVENATTAGQKAFAFGWLCHISASVTAEPMVNNIVGGPYRIHWWRNRLAANFVDSWTYGFFEQATPPTMTGDNPTPVYCDPLTGIGWPSICNANLQGFFNVTNLDGPATADGVPDAVTAMATGDISTLLASFPFPAEITSLMNDTLASTYTAPLGSPLFSTLKLPIIGVDAQLNPIPAFSGNTLASAYIGAFAVYWFMTSGSGVVGNNPTGIPTGQPEPAWIQNNTPPSPQQAGLSVGGAVCAAVLAILALFLFLTGDIVAGLASLAAALSAPIVDWSTVKNDLFWIRKVLVDQQNLLRDALVWGGLAYPPPVLLGFVDPSGNTLPVTDLTNVSGGTGNLPGTNVPATQGVPLCKTNALSGGRVDGVARTFAYPYGLDTTLGAADLNFASYPIGINPEQPTTDNIIGPGLYANAFIQSNAAVSNGGIMNGGATRPTADKTFGDAVANAIQIISKKAQGLPDYNLDADRGYGWLTWDPQAGSTPSNPPVAAVPEP